MRSKKVSAELVLAKMQLTGTLLLLATIKIESIQRVMTTREAERVLMGEGSRE